MSTQTTPTPSSANRTTPAQTPRASARGAWRLIAQREILVKLRDKSFIFSTFLTLAIIGASIGWQAWNADRHRDYTIVAVADDAAMADTIATAAEQSGDNVGITVTRVPDGGAAKAALADGSADGWLHEDGGTWTLTGQREVDDRLEGLTTETVGGVVRAQNAQRAGTDLAAIEKGTEVRTALVVGDQKEQLVAKVVGLAMAFLFYFAALLFGIALATSVVEEKQSRIVEIITASIPVRQLLLGKVVGNVLLAIGQLVLYTTVALVGVSFTPFASTIPAMSSGLLWFVLFFVVGFTVIATLYAVAGALASRTEDVQSTSVPVTMLVMLMFFGAMFLDGAPKTVASFVPPLSAVLMPMRIVEGTAQWWEPVLALALLLGAGLGVVLAAERIYRRALLQTGGKLTVRQAWTAET